ncbi:aminotransferase class I/II-fold pyridoxal phosphate-dependent enzyme [Streptomyces sp. NPDC050448]|uniref:aminotransferase class I/II-fold pyridoxal phosphate-dependent enzyme n=1 Tax=Streptomyces sp. NPDC050448 TaxID=3155404 RepID=UPI0034498605
MGESMVARSLDDNARLAREELDSAPSEFLPARERESAGNREVFGRTGLRQGGSGQPGPPDTATKILGRTWPQPFAVGLPAGPVRPEDELDVVRAAGRTGLPVLVGAFTGLAALAAATDGPLWLRLPAGGDRDTMRDLARSAEAAGFEALVLTPGPGRPAGDGAGAADLAWLRSVASLPLLVAGVRTAADAVLALERGADGLVAEELATLPSIAAAVAGRVPVLLYGGVRRGADILVSLATGADAVLLDRPVLEGLVVGGREGVAEVLEALAAELAGALAFTGTGSAADAGPELLRTAPGPVPTAAAVPGAVAKAAAARGGAGDADLSKADLHTSVSDPVLDTMNFLNEVTHRYPDAISFAPGRPYDGFFDTEEIFTHIRRYLDHLAEQGSSARQIRTAMYQYGPTAGQIREIIADSLRADENIDVPAASIVVTVGAQEAMLLVLRALLSGPDDVLLVASPCYVGITGAARLLDLTVTAVEEREEGFSCADLEAAILRERALGRRPRAFYVIPDHSNPSGTTMSTDTRTELLDIAERHGILLLEDSPYRMVSPGTPLPTLKSLDRARSVVHLGSFAKTVFPGARVGFAVADQRVVDDSGRTSLLADELAKIKSMVTVNTSSLSQAAVAGTLLAAGGRVSELNSEAAAHYGEAMRATLASLDAHLPAARREALGVRWNEPTGGFFLTLNVPFRADNEALTRSAQEYGVIWTPMAYFHPQGGGHHGIRLSTSYLTTAEIEEGTARLVRFITDQSARS